MNLLPFSSQSCSFSIHWLQPAPTGDAKSVSGWEVEKRLRKRQEWGKSPTAKFRNQDYKPRAIGSASELSDWREHTQQVSGVEVLQGTLKRDTSVYREGRGLRSSLTSDQQVGEGSSDHRSPLSRHQGVPRSQELTTLN